MSKLIRPQDLNLQEVIMTVINKLLLAKIMHSQYLQQKERCNHTYKKKKQSPPNKLVLPVIALLACFKTTWKLTAIKFVVIIECYITTCKDKVYTGGEREEGKEEKMVLVYF